MSDENQEPTTDDQPPTTDQPAEGAADQPGADQDTPFRDLAAANAEVQRLRRENAGRRVSARELQAQVDALRAQDAGADLQRQLDELRQQQAQTAEVQGQIAEVQQQLARLQAAGEAGISPQLLAASEELRGATTAEEMRAASEKIARLAAAPANGSRNPAPPRTPSTPPSLDEQLTSALRGQNMREVERLNAEKLAEMGGT